MRQKGERRVSYIKRLCKENNITIDMLVREADLPRSTISNWQKKEPAAFENYDKLIETVEIIKKRNHEKTI